MAEYYSYKWRINVIANPDYLHQQSMTKSHNMRPQVIPFLPILISFFTFVKTVKHDNTNY